MQLLLATMNLQQPRKNNMTFDDMAEVMNTTFKQCQELRIAGQSEYAGGNVDAFANFRRVAEDLHLDQKQVLWVYAMKHKDGIANYLNGYISQRENVAGRINDLIVYLCLLKGMIQEGNALDQMQYGASVVAARNPLPLTGR